MATVTKRRGRYVLDFYDNQGKRQRMTMKEGTTLKKAKEKLREIEEQISRGLFMPDKKIPTFNQVADDWLQHKKTTIRNSTWSVYEGHTKHHFPEFSDLKIDRISVSMIEQWINKRLQDEIPIGTIRKVLVSMGQIFKYAARHRYISYNPFQDAERPRGQSKKDNIRVLRPGEINNLLEGVADTKYKTLFTLAIMSGARQGELLGLKWSDMDWSNSQVCINRSFNNQEWFDVKTETSRRRIDLGPSTIAEMKRWRIACPPNDLGLVFPNEAGGPIDHHNLVRRHFAPALKKAKLGHVRFHDLRHTYASLLIEQGENIKYIQSQLGHSSPTVTLNVYAHLMRDVNQEAACRLENSILNPTGHKMVTRKNK